MHNTTLALVVLSLFTTVDKAAETEGDLLEQAQRHNRLWFWWQVKLTCIALFFRNLHEEPGKLLLGGYAVYELVLKLAWWALLPLRFTLRSSLDLNAAQFVLMNNSINMLVAFGLGALLTRLSPKHGGQITFLAVGFMLGRVVLLDGIVFVPKFVAVALLPALLGVLLLKWITLRRSGNINASFTAR